jgi:molybdenum cofactor sulfurtransferase
LKVTEWEVCDTGLLYDRQWMIVSENGVTISQKREPKLCLIKPNIDLVNKTLTLTFPGNSKRSQTVTLIFPGNSKRSQTLILTFPGNSKRSQNVYPNLP